MSQTIISSLKKCRKLIIKTQNKIEIMFKIHLSFSSIISMNDIKIFFCSSSADDRKILISWKIIKIVYKIDSNKASEINEVINKTLRRFINIIIKQIRFLFDKCIKENIQSSYFKKVFIIMLRKFKKKNYTKLSLYKSIALLNTLNKVLKSIISKRIRYVVETLKTFLNTQMNARRQRSINTILQFITKKIHTI